jgi:hypothetical protein
MSQRTITNRPGHLAGSWPEIVRTAAYISAASFVATTVLYLLDATGVLGSGPTFHRTSAGLLADEDRFFAASFNHQHAIWWDIALRDTLGPVALLSLVVVGLGLANLWGWRRPAIQLLVAAFSFGAVFATVSSLLYLGELGYWRSGDWRPLTGMATIGRSAEAIDHLSVYPEAFGYALIGLGVLLLTRIGRTAGLEPRTTALGYAEAACIVGLVVSSVAQLDVSYDVFALVAGIAVGPVFLVTLAQDASRISGPGTVGVPPS